MDNKDAIIKELELKNNLLQEEINKLNNLLENAVTNDLIRHKELIDKYADLSWKIEALAIENIKEDGISNSLFRQLVRELLSNHFESNTTDNKAKVFDINNDIVSDFWIETYNSGIIQLLINTVERYEEFHVRNNNEIAFCFDENEIPKYVLTITELEIPKRMLRLINQEKDQISIYWIPYILIKNVN